MQLRAPLPHFHNRPVPFSGRALRDVLEDRTLRAIAAVGRLNAWDYSSDKAGEISAAYDLTVPIPDWEGGSVQFAATDDQQMVAVWAWNVRGDEALLVCTPTVRLSSAPPHVSTYGNTIQASLTERILTATRVDAAATEARRWVDRNLANVAAELSEWRPLHHRRIRDALRKRRELLERVRELRGAE